METSLINNMAHVFTVTIGTGQMGVESYCRNLVCQSRLFYTRQFLVYLVFGFSFLVDCNFDSNACSWKNLGGDQFDWIRKSHSTPSSSTGPSGDRSGKGNCSDTRGGWGYSNM